jgi:hypothetical protein
MTTTDPMPDSANRGQCQEYPSLGHPFDPSCPPSGYKTPFALLSGEHDPYCGVPSPDFFQYHRKHAGNPNCNKNFYRAARKAAKQRHQAFEADMNSWGNLRAAESTFLQCMTEYEHFSKGGPAYRPGIIERLFDRLNGKQRIQNLREARQAAIDSHNALQEIKRRHIDLIRKQGYHGDFEGGPI